MNLDLAASFFPPYGEVIKRLEKEIKETKERKEDLQRISSLKNELNVLKNEEQKLKEELEHLHAKDRFDRFEERITPDPSHVRRP